MNKIITFFCKEGQKPQEIEAVKHIWWTVPAVTKVLAETMPKDKKESLAEWRLKVGEEEANRIVKESVERGKAFDAAINKLKQFGKSEIAYIDTYFDKKSIDNLQMGFVCIIDEIMIEGKKTPIGYKGFIDFEMDGYIADTKTWGKHKIDDKGFPRAEWVDRDYYLQICAYAKALGKDKAIIIGSDGNSFQDFPVFDIRNYYKEFETRLMSYILKTKGNYFQHNKND